MNRRGTVVTLAMTAVVAVGVAPAFATADKAKAKPLKGTFSYIDVTPDASITVFGTAGKRSGFCVGDLPASPADVNVHALKVTGPGTLTVLGHNVLDWAMEIRDSKNNLLAGSDGGLPQDSEGAVAPLTKAGTYKVIYCNLTGAPTTTADYTFKPR